MNYPAKGRLRHIEVSATAGDVVTNKSPTAGYRWIVLHGKITLVCDATVANRNVYITLTDGTNEISVIGRNQTAYTAGQTRAVYLVPIRSVDQDWAFLGTTLGSGTAVGENCILEGADQFRITISGGVAGDSYSGYITVLEFKL